MSIEPVKDYQQAAKVLRDTNLRQGLYDEGAVLMEGVLVNLHGEKHRARRGLENKVFRRGFFSHYEKDVFPKTLALTIDQFVSNGGGDLVGGDAAVGAPHRVSHRTVVIVSSVAGVIVLFSW